MIGTLLVIDNTTKKVYKIKVSDELEPKVVFYVDKRKKVSLKTILR